MFPMTALQSWAFIASLITLVVLTIVLMVTTFGPFGTNKQTPLALEMSNDDGRDRRDNAAANDAPWERQRPNIDRPYDWSVDGL